MYKTYAEHNSNLILSTESIKLAVYSIEEIYWVLTCSIQCFGEHSLVTQKSKMFQINKLLENVCKQQK